VLGIFGLLAGIGVNWSSIEYYRDLATSDPPTTAEGPKAAVGDGAAPPPRRSEEAPPAS
jgi:hypothetical protein